MTTEGSKGGVEVDVIGDGGIHTDSEEDPEDEDKSADSDGFSELEDENVTHKPPPPDKRDGYATYYPRGAWGSNPTVCPQSIPKGKLPMTNLVITWTETESCSTEPECQQRCREVQEAHTFIRKLPDIRYHFLIGGDGCLYEGRGWNKKGEDYTPQVGGKYTDTLNKQHIEVAIIGRSSTPVTKQQLDVLSTVVTMGQTEDWITTNFSVYWNVGQTVQFYKVYDATDELNPMLHGERQGDS